MVDFSLSASELAIRRAARSFASQQIAKAKSTYLPYASHADRFQSLRPLYDTAFSSGLIKAQIPSAIGGASESLVEAAIFVEEFYAVDPSASLTIFGTGLGLTPLALAYKPEFKSFLEPFLTTDLGGGRAPLASLVFSEPTGVANWLEPNGKGLQTTAYFDDEKNEWVVNGEKVWATNCAGFDFEGADLACVITRRVKKGMDVREHVSERREDDAMILIVTKGDIQRSGKGSFEVLNHQQIVGHTAASGPRVKYTNVRVPAKNLLCPPGTAAAILTATFEISACLVGAMGTGIQRAAFDAALRFCKSDARGGTVPILSRQSVADLLIDIKMRTETSRYLTWKAAHCLHSGPGEWEQRRELAIEAKVYCSDSAVKSCIDAINAVGVSAYDESAGFNELLNNALALPIFDGGNIGIRRRALQELFGREGYNPWLTAFGDDEE